MSIKKNTDGSDFPRAILATFLIALAFSALAQTPTISTAAEPEKRKTSPLVEAARAGRAGSTGKKSPISITDRNLKRAPKSKKAAPERPKAVPVEDVVEVAADPAPALTDELAAALRNVNSLEKEMLRLEQNYYDESDPSYRETVIRKRFDDAKRQLIAARETLAELRGVAERPADSPQARPQ